MGEGLHPTDEQETVRLVHQVISSYGINMRQVQVVHEAHERWPPSDYVPVSPSYSPKSPLYAPEPDPEAEPDPDEKAHHHLPNGPRGRHR